MLIEEGGQLGRDRSERLPGTARGDGGVQFTGIL